MMASSKFVPLALFCWLLLVGSAPAEELWVRNKPFAGRVEGRGTSMKVELRPLLEALKLQPIIEGDFLLFGDFRVPIEQSGGTEMVLLREFAVGAGLKVKANPSLGTVDVYSEAAGAGDQGDWSSVAEAASKAGGSGNSVQSTDYTLKVPPQMQLINDPQAMQALKSQVQQGGGAGNPALDSASVKFVGVLRDGPQSAVMMLVNASGLPPTNSLTPESEKEYIMGFEQGFSQKGGTLVSGPTPSQIAGRRWYKLVHLRPGRGEEQRTESFITLDGPGGKIWMAIFGDNVSTFARTAPIFQQAVQTLQVK